ncbi:NAD(P)H-quinone oxidoreductase [Flectobacillus roseus]|uniref:NAD(P)H-quinone oxidoreductase n=1 Tax=Flectobacillus roseus TaxID=502259 RepID=A0ABT6Y3V7_9BACT|nr:NAD(P)H-quinone oxidoreductase [Flectobacillus roseus]MDI9858235.1 NAD(P)H-quinone oxidoreductase [Flectobacillus roseus]
MNAIKITAFGAPENMIWSEYPDPVCGAEEVIIEIYAAGVNRPDVLQRKGHYPAPEGAPADIAGLEVAGQIIEIGEKVTRWKLGDEVCALVAGGGYAEKVNVHESVCLPIPTGFSLEEAACLPETVYTVWHNVFQRGNLQAGEGILIHGGSSGIGTSAIQLAKAFGAKVFVTVGNEEKGKACLELGADGFVNYKTQDFLEVLKEESIHVILDMIGGDYFSKNIDLLQADGRLVYINAMGGKNVQIDILKMMQKRLTITGSTLRAREVSFKASLTTEIYGKVWPILEQGLFKVPIFASFPMPQASEAHRLMESSAHIGKIVLVK